MNKTMNEDSDSKRSGPVQGARPERARDQSHDLRLIAMDAEDLAVVSANLQDAIVRVADMAWLPAENRFALVASRFDWVAAGAGRCERARCGLHFDFVRNVRLTGFDQTKKNRLLNLLGMTFSAGEVPSGTVEIVFSGDAAVRLEVDCIEAQMRDLGVRWKARARPGHELTDADIPPDEKPDGTEHPESSG